MRGDCWGTWLIMLGFMDLGWPRVCRRSALVLLKYVKQSISKIWQTKLIEYISQQLWGWIIWCLFRVFCCQGHSVLWLCFMLLYWSVLHNLYYSYIAIFNKFGLLTRANIYYGVVVYCKDVACALRRWHIEQVMDKDIDQGRWGQNIE